MEILERWLIDFANPLVRDHRVHGKHILPGLSYIDLIFQVFQGHGLEWDTLELRNLVIHQPLLVTREQGVLLEIHCQETREGLWQVEAAGQGLRDGGVTGEPRRYALAEMRRRDRSAFPEVIDLRSVVAAAPPTSLDESYARCRSAGLLHEAFMRAEGAVYVDAQNIHVDCQLSPAAAASAGGVLFHPTLLDASLTCGGGALRSWLDPSAAQDLELPLFYGEFRASGLLQERCVARIRRGSLRKTAELTYYTVDFFDPEGRKVAELVDFASKRVRDGVLGEPARAPRSTIATHGLRDGDAPARTSDDIGDTADAPIITLLRELIAQRVGESPDQIDPAMGYFELGIGSADLLDLVRTLEERLGESLPPTLLFEYVTIEQLAAHLAERWPGHAAMGGGAQGDAAIASEQVVRPVPTPQSPAPSDGDVAIIGMSGRFPMARDTEEYWRNLVAGRDCVTEVPPSRWDWRQYEDLRSPSGKPLSRWGGFIDDPDGFDAQFFHISPRELELVDPQERLFLEVCWEAIEDSGYTPANLVAPRGQSARRPVGVFVGVMHKDYVLIANEARTADEQVLTFQCNASIANRVSYVCDFHGPSMAIDTVCSSSLVATHQALQSLRTGECDVAIAGGVNLSLHPAKYLAYGLMDMHASDGRCRAFGAGGDGYVSSEAVGAVLLKPLRAAIADGDHIYAVIKASATNHVGAVSGLTVPSPVAQADLIASCMERAGVEARTLSYVEAHGTGTSLGDPIEFDGLVKAFRRTTADTQFCALGSVKSNIGHAESAAGVAALIKVALQLNRRTLTPSLHSDAPNPHIDWPNSPFVLQRQATPWAAPTVWQADGEIALPRRAALSSFGATGSNAHLVLEEFESIAADAQAARGPVVVPLAARDMERLRAYAERLRQFLAPSASETASDGLLGAPLRPALADLAYTLQVGRKPLKARVAFVADSLDGLLSQLDGFRLGRQDIEDCYSNDTPGQGSVRALDDVLARAAGSPPSAEALREVAQIWASGLSVDWTQLHGAGERRRVSLPTYPFARQRYWIESATTAAPAPAPDRSEAQVSAGTTLDLETRCVERAWVAAPLDSFASHESSWDQQVLLHVHYQALEPQLRRQLPHNRLDLFGGEAGFDIEPLAQIVFARVQALLRTKLTRPVLLQLVLADDTASEVLTGLTGLFKTAQLENPAFRGQIVLLDPAADADALATVIREEASAEPAAEEVRRSGQDREIPIWRNRATNPDRARPLWRDHGVYLITGGLGGLGLIVAEDIVSTAQGARLILTGRSELTPVTRRRLQALNRNDAQVEYVQLDIADAPGVQALVKRILANHHALNGVLHSAGVIDDEFIIRKARERFGAVLAPKIQGALNLDRATRDVPLDFMIFFSSLAGLFGGVGQADYALANAVLDRFAAQRQTQAARGDRQGRTLSIAWPLWEEGGMRMDPASLAQMRQRGFHPLPTAAGVAALHRAWASDAAVVAVLYGQAAALDALLAATPSSAAADAALDEPAAAPLTVREAQAVRDGVLLRLRGLLSEVTKLGLEAVDGDEPLETYGIDSIMIVQLNQKLGLTFSDLPKTVFYEHATLDSLADHLVEAQATACQLWVGIEPEGRDPVERAQAEARSPAPRTSPPTERPIGPAQASGARDIAIIGLAGRYPQAPDLDTFWEILEAGRDCVTEIPSDRWPLDGFYEPDPDRAIASGKSYARWGGFLEGFEEFDPLFFNISPREAASIDPQERLFLQASWEVLEDAGYTRQTLADRHGSRVGVFVGVTKTGYNLFGPALWERGETVYPHTSFSSIANRVSYVLDLNGPSMPVDTMCSASLTAIYEACEHILRGDCELAIAGGVNLYLHPSAYVSLAAARMLSTDGACKSFGEGGDGFVPGEGVGAVLLKPLAEAEADGDHIYGVIRGASINHGGKTNGYTVPNPLAQRDLVEKALAKAGVHPRAVSYIEAHGTGTSLGDPIEIAGLTQAFRRQTKDDQFCAIGSVKTNIGHLESAAGIAGLTKVLLQMRHGALAPSLHAESLNPNIDFGRTPFWVARDGGAWARPVAEIHGVDAEQPRIAGVSSFGAGGANAHVIVQEYVPSSEPTAVAATGDGAFIIVLSAKAEVQLRQAASRLVAHIRGRALTDRDLPSLAYTLQTGREAMDERLGLSVRSIGELCRRLEAWADGTGADGDQPVHRGDAKDRKQALSSFNADEDGRALLATWFEKGKHGQILDLWVRGLAVDWSRLYGPVPPRISLPTYPFARERYWLTPPRTAQPQAPATPTRDHSPDQKPAHPTTLLAHPVWRGAVAAAPGVDRQGTDGHYVLLGSGHAKHVDALKAEHPSLTFLTLAEPRAPGALDLDRRLADCRAGFDQIAGLMKANARRHLLVQVFLEAETADDGAGALAAAFGGLLGTGRLESSRFAGQVIVLPTATAVADLSRALMENATPAARQDRRIRYTEGRREVLGFDLAASPADTTSPSPWVDGGVYLVTGGAGGLGLLFAETIARSVEQPRIVLVGRTDLEEVKLARVDALRASSGAHIEYIRLDVADAAAVQACVDAIVSRHGALNGLIHAAGVLRDSLMINKPGIDFDEVMQPKVRGSWNLDQATRNLGLDVFVLFSSLSGVFGNMGQADYAAANGFLDGFAAWRNQKVAKGERSGHTLSVDWPLWDGGGMGVSIERLEDLRREGFEPLPADVGTQVLIQALAGPADQVLVLHGDTARLTALLGISTPSRPALHISGAEQASKTPAMSTSTVVEPSVRDALIQQLTETIEQQLAIPSGGVDPRSNFSEYGFDSIGLGTFSKALNRRYGLELYPTVFFEYPTVQEFAGFLLQEHGDRLARELGPPAAAAPTTSPEPNREPDIDADDEKAASPAGSFSPVAIIGLSGSFPGAPDLSAFWDNLKQGRDCITEVPSDRWDHRRFYDPDKDTQDKSYSKWGGFLENASRFDPLFFGMSPSAAEYAAPQELLFLETVWNLTEASGVTRDALAARYRGRVGVYVGSTFHHHGYPGGAPHKATAGFVNAQAAIANRASHFLGVTGPSLVVDTMCSSAATAIHLACRDLQRGDCDLAIAGGVNLSTHPDKYVGLCQAQLLGSSLESRSFAAGDGYHPAEAVGAMLLKPLAKALEDGDPVLAVIRGAAMKHGGRENTYSAPNPNIQAELFREVCEAAAIPLGTISYVEAAANGSELGDAIEVVALSRAFGDGLGGGQLGAIGSVKPSIGHAEAASAMTQIAKVVLQLQHGELAPTLAPRSPNPNIQFEKTPFRLALHSQPWARPPRDGPSQGEDVPRRALINSFGAGGTYVSLVLEEAPPASAREQQDPPTTGAVILAVSARTVGQLRMRLADLRDYLARHPDISLRDLEGALLLEREAMTVRWATVVSSVEDAIGAVDRRLEDAPANADGGPQYFRDLGAVPRPAASPAIVDAAITPTTTHADLRHAAQLWAEGAEVRWGERPRGLARGLPPLPAYPFSRIDIRGGSLSGGAVQDRAAEIEGQAAALSPGTRALRAALLSQFGVPPEEASAGRSLSELGVNSVGLVRLRHELERTLACEIPLLALSPSRPLAETAAELDRAIGAGNASNTEGEGGRRQIDLPSLTPAPAERHEPFPLSEIQEAFAVGRKLGDRPTGAHLYFEFETHDLDIHRLNRAWNSLLAHHEMLRAVLCDDGRQRISWEASTFRIKVKDLRSETEDARESILRAQREQMLGHVYDLAQWPLFDLRVSLCPEFAIVHVSLDEFIVDGMSVDLLFRQWDRIYNEPDWRPPPLEVSFRDVVIAQKRFGASERAQRDLDYWLSKFGEGLSGPVPLRPAGGEGTRLRLNGNLPDEAWSRLKARAEASGASPTVLLMTVFAAVLSERSEKGPFALLLTLFNRPPVHPQIDEVVAPFTSTNIFLADGDRDQPLDVLLSENQRRLWSDLDHGSVSGIRVLRELKARRRLPGGFSLPVVFTAMLNSLGGSPPPGGGLFTRPRLVLNHTPQVALDHQVSETDGELRITWDVDDSLFDASSLRTMFAAYKGALERLAQPISDWRTTSLVELIGEAKRTIAPLPILSHDPEGRHEPFPLSEQQQAYLFGRSPHAAGGGKGCQCYYEFQVRDLDLPRLEQAWRAVVAAHPMLSAEVLPDGFQVLPRGARPARMEVADLSGLSAVDRAAVLAQTKARMMQIIPLDQPPYAELRVSLCGQGHARVHFCLDMLIADGPSIAIVLQDLLSLYAKPEGQSRSVETTFRDYMVWRQAYRGSTAAQQDLAYWEAKFATLPPGPALGGAADRAGAPGARTRLKARLQGWSRIKARASDLGVSASAVLLTAFMDVLTAWNDGAPFSVVVPGWTRPPVHPDIHRIVGDFTSMCWIASCDPSVGGFTQRVHHYDRALLDDLSHQAGSGLAAMRKATAKRGRRALSFPVVFTDLVPNASGEALPVGFELVESLSQTPQVLLDCMAHDLDDDLDFYWDLQSSAFSADVVGEMFDQYVSLLRSLGEPDADWLQLARPPGVEPPSAPVRRALEPGE